MRAPCSCSMCDRYHWEGQPWAPGMWGQTFLGLVVVATAAAAAAADDADSGDHGGGSGHGGGGDGRGGADGGGAGRRGGGGGQPGSSSSNTNDSSNGGGGSSSSSSSGSGGNSFGLQVMYPSLTAAGVGTINLASARNFSALRSDGFWVSAPRSERLAVFPTTFPAGPLDLVATVAAPAGAAGDGCVHALCVFLCVCVSLCVCVRYSSVL